MKSVHPEEQPLESPCRESPPRLTKESIDNKTINNPLGPNPSTDGVHAGRDLKEASS